MSCFWQVEVAKWQKYKFKWLNGKNGQVQGAAYVLCLDTNTKKTIYVCIHENDEYSKKNDET